MPEATHGRSPSWARERIHDRATYVTRQASRLLRYYARARDVCPTQISRELSGERRSLMTEFFRLVWDATLLGGHTARVEVPMVLTELYALHRQALRMLDPGDVVARWRERLRREQVLEGEGNRATTDYLQGGLDLGDMLSAHRRELAMDAGIVADGEILLDLGLDPRELGR